MHRKAVESVLLRRPFQPFRMVLTNGEHFDVLHPDLVIVGHRFIAVGSPRGQSLSDDEMLVYWIDLIHIIYIRRL